MHLPFSRSGYYRFVSLIASLVVITVALTGNTTAGAQTPTPTPTPTGTGVTPVKPDLISNVRIRIVNSVINRVNNARTVRIQPEWFLLPENSSLASVNNKEERFRRPDPKYLKPFTLRFTNAQLKKGVAGWGPELAKVPVPEGLDRALLQKQGGLLGDVTPFDADAWRASYLKYWVGDMLPDPMAYTAQDLDNNSISPQSILTQRRDHALLALLLRTGGAEAVLSIKDAAPGAVSIKPVPGSDGEFEVRQYPIRYKNPKNGQPSYYFRSVIVARLPEYEVTIFDPSLKTVVLETRAEWVPRDGQTPSIFALGVSDPVLKFGEVTLEPEAVLKTKIDEVEDSGGPSRFESNLTLFGGVDAANLIAGSFLQGTEDTSVITGGLATKKGVSSFVGFTREWGDPFAAVRPGFLLGVNPKDANQLFLGMGIRSRYLNIGAGITSTEENRADRTPAGQGRFQKGELAVMFSLDLSRALGGKKVTNKLTVDRTGAGGTIGLDSDSLAKNLGGIALGLKNTIVPSAKVELKLRKRGANGEPDLKAPLITLNPNLAFQTIYLPAGEYEVVLDKIYILKDSEGNKAPTITAQKNKWIALGVSGTPFTLVKL